MRQPPRPIPALARAVALAVVWALLAAGLTLVFFVHDERSAVLASHDATIRPTLDETAVLHTGALLPDARLALESRPGVEIWLGDTQAQSIDELVERYAFIASQPDGQVQQIRAAVGEMAVSATIRGGALAMLPVLGWLLLGSDRRREVTALLGTPRGVAALLALGLIATLVWQPWQEDVADSPHDWIPLADALPPGVPLVPGLEGVELSGSATTRQTSRLVRSAVDTYDRSRTFYDAAAADAADLELHEPAEDETVALLVSDRHDNVGMDRVARAIAERARATLVLNAGDDTSTGQSWEAFSLDSLQAAFGDWPRYGVAGNHDHGGFVREHLAGHGWTMLDGAVVDGPDGITLLGVDDPRSSGLGSWRDERGLSYEDVRTRLADVACEADERVSTVLVHSADLGDEALARGCVDLVVGGDLHVRTGPEPVVGENGETGFRYTTGTTGGAAYAIAVGSKPRRSAEVSLITYRDARPVGIESVTLQTNGVLVVTPYVTLESVED